MKGLPLVVALGLLAVSLAGCVNEDESTTDARSRGFALSVADLQRVRVEVYANATGGTSLHVELEREDGSNLAEGDMGANGRVANTTVEADVTGLNATWVLVTLAEGASATVYVRAVGVAADGSEVVLREETFQL